jgi:hypothetical protein
MTKRVRTTATKNRVLDAEQAQPLDRVPDLTALLRLPAMAVRMANTRQWAVFTAAGDVEQLVEDIQMLSTDDADYFSELLILMQNIETAAVNTLLTAREGVAALRDIIENM